MLKTNILGGVNMKNTLVKIIAITSIIIGVLMLSACSYETDNDIANKNISKLIAAIENEDHVGIKSLFAPNIIAEIDDFDQNINDLLSYYIGKNGSYGSHGLGTEYDRDSGIEKRWHNMSYDITTTEDVFRIAIIWYIQDTEDVGNVGIWSFYIIRFEDDPYPNYDYGGDGLWSPGLHIGKTYIGELD
jgi:hypothetical protein